jgi:hypothetical protein
MERIWRFRSLCDMFTCSSERLLCVKEKKMWGGGYRNAPLFTNKLQFQSLFVCLIVFSLLAATYSEHFRRLIVTTGKIQMRY